MTPRQRRTGAPASRNVSKVVYLTIESHPSKSEISERLNES
ncbi:hypothetical protein PUN4_600035 [Paraburkholderia unamae]|nr:hypothetical protein PUN4_600035 [Paraburkholderia unamae]